MDFVIANQEKVNAMIKTTLKIDGMMCGMCESHMNDLIRKNFQVKKVTSSAKDGETVIIVIMRSIFRGQKKRSKRLVTNSFPTRVNHMRKKDFSILENNRNIWKNQAKCAGVVRTSAHCGITKVMLQ